MKARRTRPGEKWVSRLERAALALGRSQRHTLAFRAVAVRVIDEIHEYEAAHPPVPTPATPLTRYARAHRELRQLSRVLEGNRALRALRAAEILRGRE